MSASNSPTRVPRPRQRHGQVHRRGGLAHAALAGRDGHDMPDAGQQLRGGRGAPGRGRLPVGGQHGRYVQHAGQPGQQRLRAGPHRLHGARGLAVGQQCQVHQPVAHRQPLHQPGGDDVTAWTPGPATAPQRLHQGRFVDCGPVSVLRQLANPLCHVIIQSSPVGCRLMRRGYGARRRRCQRRPA